jgi:anti-sigma factor RsiW
MYWSRRFPESPPAGFCPLAADCFTSRLHLHAFVDGELDTDIPGSALREVILEHLAHCPRCERVERQLRALRRRLLAHGIDMAQLAEERASPEFRARMARLLAG